MPVTPSFDLKAAHRYFAADCFNNAWTLIEKPDRTPEEDEQMLRLNQASMWHWTQREDCTNRSLSIGYWQASRIHALLGRAAEARHYGELSLKYGSEEPPFFRGYAHEALARAEAKAGDRAAARPPGRGAEPGRGRDGRGRTEAPSGRPELAGLTPEPPGFRGAAGPLSVPSFFVSTLLFSVSILRGPSLLVDHGSGPSPRA